MAPVMRELAEHPEVELQIIATNMHLSPEFGMTVSEIEGDGFMVDCRIESLEPGDTPGATVRSMAKVQTGLADAFTRLQPNMVVILGDRYEALAAASAAVVFGIPIAHLHGGETTEGAIDDAFRHAITKLSTYHFASTPQYADKIVSMGAPKQNVFHSGGPGAQGYDMEGTEAYEFVEKTGMNPDEPFILLAFHPVTRLPDNGKQELKAITEALDSFISQGYRVLVTMPNSDPGNSDIREFLKNWSENALPGMVILVESLGARLFHYAMDKAMAMVGNSSAALIEAPTHRLPAVNVGNRQKGRAHGISVIDVPGEKARIEAALRAALSVEMKSVMMGLTISSLNPYFKENSSHYISEKLVNL